MRLAEPATVEAAVEAAEAAFWEAVVIAYPEARTGDFPPQDTVFLRATLTNAVRTWVELNVPQEAAR